MTLTAIDEAQDALLALLLADAAFTSLVSGDRVSLGYPHNGPDQIWSSDVDYAWLAEQVDDWTMSSPDLPGSEHDEQFTLTLHLVAASKADFKTARDRVLEMARAVSAAIAADWTLGGAVVNCYPSGGRMDGGKVDSGRAAQLSMSLYVSAYPAE